MFAAQVDNSVPVCSRTGVTAVVCDALDLKGVEGALDGCDAAITTLGGASRDGEEKRVDYVGNRNVIESAGILGITRLVLVTSVGCGSSREAISDEVYQVMSLSSIEEACVGMMYWLDFFIAPRAGGGSKITRQYPHF